jgi:hypothetical protein
MALSEMFYSFVVSSLATCFLATLGFCLKSKCDRIKFGPLEIHRAVELEHDIETPQIEMPSFKPPPRTQSLDATIHGNKN